MRTGNVKQPIYVHEFKVRVLLVYFTHFYAFTWLNFFGGREQEVRPGILKIGCQIIGEVKNSRKKYEFDPNVGETQKSRRLDALKRACLRS